MMAPHLRFFAKTSHPERTDSMSNQKPNSGPQAGFSLVEIVVAMFILALVAVSLAPILVSSLKQTATNALSTQATHLASVQMDAVRAQTPNCAALTAYASSTLPVAATGQGVSLSITQAIGACPSTYPGTAPFTVTVRRTDTNEVLATATTLVYLQSAQ
jgi:prepilin-type N-terminal cleavage/methylation domain-containing protein